MTFHQGVPRMTQEPSQSCDPDEVALKSFFLGPQSENADWFRAVIERVIDTYIDWRRRIHPDDGTAISVADRGTPEFQKKRERFRYYLHELLQRFEGEVPKFSPRYIGHMFSETSMPAMVGHVVTLLHNPNNISGESSRVGVKIEDEAVTALAEMLGFDPEQGSGHFTSGGTVANVEAMVRARHRLERFLARGARARRDDQWEGSIFEAAQMGWDIYDRLGLGGLEGNGEEQDYMPGKANPFAVASKFAQVFEESYRGPVILVPAHKHYSWVKGVELLGMGKESFWPVKLDERGMMCIEDLRRRIMEAHQRGRPIMMVVSVTGTTELGTFDPVGQIQDLLDELAEARGWHIYHHVDAAYGGFFAANVCGERPDCLMDGGLCDAVAAIHRANSVTLDPHKLGYVPYASGAFIAADRREYYSNSVDAPYLAFEHDSDRGPQTIEGSRSAAGAVATWLTARSIGLDADGYGWILRRTITARRRMQKVLESSELPVRIVSPSSNILAFCVAHDGEALTEINARSKQIYQIFSPEEDGPFYVSRTILRVSEYGALLDSLLSSWECDRDADELVLIRLCLMNPFIESQETAVDYPAEFAQALVDAVSS